MSGQETGRIIGSLVGTTALFAISSAAAGNFLPFVYYLGIIGIALIVLLAIVGGGWAGVRIHAFLTDRALNEAFSRVVSNGNHTEVLPVPQDPFAHVS